jgi:pimeloyl-ACP methyl ester carboxylesterase
MTGDLENRTSRVDFAFLHGGGQGSWVWAETTAALQQQAGKRPVYSIALDVPGCGSKRGRDTSGIDTDAVVTELLADLTASGLKDIVLVGHSQGGTVLPRLAARRPDLFRRIVYVSCCMPLPGQTIQQMMGTGLHGSNPKEVGWPLDPATHGVHERYPVMFCNDMAPAPRDAFLGKLGKDNWPGRTYADTDWSTRHPQSMPSTYVVCLQDGVLPVAWQETFATRVNALGRVHIDAGHQVMNTRPQALAEALLHEATA